MVTTGEVEKRLRIIIEAQDQTQASFNTVQTNIKRLQNLGAREKLLGGAGLSDDQRMLVQNLKETADVQKGVMNRNKLMINQMNRQIRLGRQFKFEYLGIMFAGMALQRATDQFLRSAITAYNEVFDETSAFEQITNKLTASWKFFQFQLIDALTTSELFQNLVSMTAKLVDWFSQLDSSFRTGIVATAAAAFAVGGSLYFIGQMALGLLSLKMVWGSGVLQKLGTGFSNNPIVGGMTMAQLIGTGILIKATLDLFKSETFDQTIESVATGLVGLGFVFSKSKWSLPLLIIGTVVLAKDELKSVGEELQEWGANALKKAAEEAGNEWKGLSFEAQTLLGGVLGIGAFIGGSAARAPGDIFDLIEAGYENIRASNEEFARSAVEKGQVVSTAFAGEEKTSIAGSAKVAKTEVDHVKESIDAIPDNTVKTITVRTVYEGGASPSAQLPP